MRRFYLVSYDIPDDKRRARVFKLMRGWGERVQYSVFCCQLNSAGTPGADRGAEERA
ncbi:MAG: CRISPR-associated endonuclease Cas2 [Kiritimatiellia bacterium]